jgi:hypothetical protein
VCCCFRKVNADANWGSLTDNALVVIKCEVTQRGSVD